METTLSKLEKLVTTSKNYIEVQTQYVTLIIVDRVSKALANLVTKVAISILIFLVIIFTSLAISFALGEWYGKTWFGFLSVAMMYLLMIIILMVTKDRLIKKPIKNEILHFFSNYGYNAKY